MYQKRGEHFVTVNAVNIRCIKWPNIRRGRNRGSHRVCLFFAYYQQLGGVVVCGAVFCWRMSVVWVFFSGKTGPFRICWMQLSVLLRIVNYFGWYIIIGLSEYTGGWNHCPLFLMRMRGKNIMQFFTGITDTTTGPTACYLLQLRLAIFTTTAIFSEVSLSCHFLPRGFLMSFCVFIGNCR